MTISALVVSYGSIGRKHAKILKTKFGIKDLTVCTKKRISKFKTIKKLHGLKKKPSYIVIASPTSKHFEQLKFIEKKFKNIKILVEKPLFDKYRKLKIKHYKNL